MVSSNQHTRPLFPLGRIVATPAALEVLAASGETPAPYLRRHECGDWGDVCSADKGANDWALRNEGRLLSVYKALGGEIIWIISEADRSSTCILLPDDY